MSEAALRPAVEEYYLNELAALTGQDSGPKPLNWRLSPKAVRMFILGSDQPIASPAGEIQIRKKFYGDDALVERCIITLAGNRGLMLVGEPGTAKSMLSELLAAAICGTSTNTIQGTAGTTEDMIKYTWNYPLLLSQGPGREALVPSPLYTGMQKGIITRFEEITRCPSEVQDSLISVLSDKVLSIPELGEEGLLFAQPGFNVIATANTRDKGVNELSSALKRRFNFETVFPIGDIKQEAKIIEEESARLLKWSGVEQPIDRDVVQILATTFHELREGITAEGTRIEQPATVLSTAEAVSVYFQAALSSYYYSDGQVTMETVLQNITGATVKENKDDLEKLKSYLNIIVKSRSIREGGLWKDYYNARGWLR